MSLSWREHLIAVVGPRAVALASRGRGAATLIGRADCVPGTNAADAVCTALTALLPSSARGRSLTVLLTSDFVRFRLVPWRDEIASADELAAYARLGFEEAFGPEVASWPLRISPEAAGGARLAAIIDPQLVARLDTMTDAAGLKLRSLQPYLMAAFNRCAAELPRSDFLFALVEPMRSSVLVARGGHWVAVRSTACADSADAHAAAIEREAALQRGRDGAAPAVFVHVPGGGATAAGLAQAVPVGRAGGAVDALLDMAMAAG